MRYARRVQARIRQATVQDAWLALALVVPDLLAFGEIAAPDTTGRQAALTAAAALPAVAALCLRRVAPVAVFAVLWAHAVTCDLLSLDGVFGYTPVFTMLAGLYTVALSRPARIAYAALVVAAVPLGLTVWYSLAALPADRRLSALAGVLMFQLALYIEVFGFGRWIRARNAEAARTRRGLAEARKAVRDERARIARELHDIVAHAVTVMVLQASGAQKVLRTDPDRASLALGDIEGLGKNAMSELRRMLTLLRSSERPGQGAVPLCGLDDLPGLFDGVRGAGVIVEFEERGPRARLPESLDLTAYRVVQEAITNVTKHAGPGTRALVRLTWSAALRIDVVDDGAGEPTVRNGELSAGQGMAGLRERVALFGGSLSAGPAGGGYQVSATLPVDAGPAPARAPDAAVPDAARRGAALPGTAQGGSP